MAIVSTILALVLLVYWWRSLHGHVDSLNLGRFSPTESQFHTGNGRIWVEVTDKTPTVWMNQLKSYAFRDVLGYFLILPCLWIAILVRSWLPRPPGRGLEMSPKRK
jgi:hypothetical protein